MEAHLNPNQCRVHEDRARGLGLNEESLAHLFSASMNKYLFPTRLVYNQSQMQNLVVST